MCVFIRPRRPHRPAADLRPQQTSRRHAPRPLRRRRKTGYGDASAQRHSRGARAARARRCRDHPRSGRVDRRGEHAEPRSRLDGVPVLDIDDDLHDCAAQPCRPGAAENQAGAFPAGRVRSTEPSCSSAVCPVAPCAPRRGRTRACCSVDAGAGNDHARAGARRRRERRAFPLGVDHRDVRRAPTDASSTPGALVR